MPGKFCASYDVGVNWLSLHTGISRECVHGRLSVYFIQKSFEITGPRIQQYGAGVISLYIKRIYRRVSAALFITW